MTWLTGMQSYSTSMASHTINAFTKGVHNTLDNENIPTDAAADEKNWVTKDGRIQLANGRLLVGSEGAVGAIYGQIFGYKVDGTKVHWRKIGTKIQYLNGSTWTDVVTGLTDGADYTFTNYSSLAGTFTYAFGIDGIFKMHNANPGSYRSMYDSSKNFKGHAFIDRGRAILWNRKEDRTGLYGSKIDPQNSNYTLVSAEVLGASGSTTYTGTLAQASSPRTVFAIAITGTTGGGAETFTDNYDGTLTGSLGGSGTINYITGAYSVTFSGSVTSGNVTANYQYENSNNGGVTDFTKSSTRLAGEGFQFPQDEGGDAIKTVLVGQDGSYFSLKAQSAYRLTLDADDTGATNEVYRRDIGVSSLRSGVSTGKGIVFINTAKPEKPELTILQKNLTGDNIEPLVLFPHFRFQNYSFSDAALDTFDRYILIACRTLNTQANDTILLCDLSSGTVDITHYNARTFAKDAGLLYIGSSITQSIYNLYSGYDDDTYPIQNYWISKAEAYKTTRLKKVRHLRFKGRIQPAQNCEVYVSYDDASYQLVGTIRGDASYVDSGSPEEIGSDIIGGTQIGGDDTQTVYPFFCQFKIKTPKFKKRSIKLTCTNIGHFDLDTVEDHDIFTFEDKIPRRFRSKQNVSLDGETTDMDNPEF